MSDEPRTEPEPYYIDGEPACGPSGCALPRAHSRGCIWSPPGMYHPAIRVSEKWKRLHPPRDTGTTPASR